jgi:hypothetical protein
MQFDRVRKEMRYGPETLVSGPPMRASSGCGADDGSATGAHRRADKRIKPGNRAQQRAAASADRGAGTCAFTSRVSTSGQGDAGNQPKRDSETFQHHSSPTKLMPR